MSDQVCVENGTWTYENIELSWGTGGVITIYFFSIFAFIFNLALYGAILYKFFKCHELSRTQIFNQSIMVSVPLTMASYQMLSIILPEAEYFLMNFFNLYESFILYKFAITAMNWLGGTDHMVEAGADSDVSFCLPPCCCFTWCFRQVKLTQNKMKFVRFLVYQLITISLLVFFIKQITHSYHFSHETLSEENPKTFLDIIQKISFFFGIYAVFIILNIGHSFKIIGEGNFKIKFTLMKSPLLLTVKSEILFNILLKAGAIPCNEFLSHDSFSKIYFCLVVLGLSLVYGLWTAVIYIRSPVVRLRQGASTRSTGQYIEI